jgi:hydrogenase maturation protein HypF
MIVELRVYGIVQGVGFRPFAYRLALKHGLTGWVVNLGDSSVGIRLEGEKKNIESYIKELKKEKPQLAEIWKIRVRELDEPQENAEFRILKSRGDKTSNPAGVPPDIGICSKCSRELETPLDRRNDYFFITCTDCGPRYSILEELPYDRERTSMKPFQMCRECKAEYTRPADRRYHAQTIACSECGPKLWLEDPKRGVVMEGAGAARMAGALLQRGKLGLIKGTGGFHLGCSAEDDHAVKRLRNALVEKGDQPLALMARDLQTAREFVKIDPIEKDLLTSWRKPIVVLEKEKDAKRIISPLVAPGLHTIGVMLPYTGLHILLFQHTDAKAFVLTSANMVGEPMAKDNEEARKEFRDLVDFSLLYDRAIVNRCDDSVLRVINSETTMLRRARGWVPLPIKVRTGFSRPVLALGGELQVTACLGEKNSAYLTPHIGNVRHLETLNFEIEAIKRMEKLTGIVPESIACDLHPDFNTTKLAERLSGEMNVPMIRVQHHRAHAAGLLAEHGLGEGIVIVADGYGYGDDGQAWGGEIFYAEGKNLGGKNYSKNYRRVSFLEPHPMLGGDLAAYYPLRIAAGILSGSLEEKALEHFLMQNKNHFPHREIEVKLLLKQLKELKEEQFRELRGNQLKELGERQLEGLREEQFREFRELRERQLRRKRGTPAESIMAKNIIAESITTKSIMAKSIMTSSCGRVLDACSALLGVCTHRTYEGEPAMKLEAAACGGEYVLGIKPEIERNMIKTAPLITCIYENLGKEKTRNLAFSAQEYIARAFAEQAIALSEEFGVKNVGISGGCALNSHMVSRLAEIFERNGLRFYQHKQIPPGDGGLSFGQAVTAAD